MPDCLKYTINGDFMRKISGTVSFDGRTFTGRAQITYDDTKMIDAISGGFIYLDRKVQLYVIEKTPDDGHFWAYSLVNAFPTGEFLGFSAKVERKADLEHAIQCHWGGEELLYKIDDAMHSPKNTHTGYARIEPLKGKIIIRRNK